MSGTGFMRFISTQKVFFFFLSLKLYLYTSTRAPFVAWKTFKRYLIFFLCVLQRLFVYTSPANSFKVTNIVSLFKLCLMFLNELLTVDYFVCYHKHIEFLLLRRHFDAGDRSATGERPKKKKNYRPT